MTTPLDTTDARTQPVEITAKGGVVQSLTIDGHPIGLVKSAHLDVDATRPPILHLDMVVPDVAVRIEGGTISIDEESAKTLRALGWTPPDNPASDRILAVSGIVQAVVNGLPRNVAERAAWTMTSDEREELRMILDALDAPPEVGISISPPDGDPENAAREKEIARAFTYAAGVVIDGEWWDISPDDPDVVRLARNGHPEIRVRVSVEILDEGDAE